MKVLQFIELGKSVGDKYKLSFQAIFIWQYVSNSIDRINFKTELKYFKIIILKQNECS